ncbi:hypothetical protein TNCV_2853221 [Trichonephila clavipes]|uniref:Uncharacterized protein n=1 Tax=Trichonephila clavipes TaxID=2585209 RepID=A0A8X6RGF0_TRICX|nr:hypothetical protein TNCV_2853221 [Trichonephila clavipes]
MVNRFTESNCQIEPYEIHPGKGLDVRLTLTVALRSLYRRQYDSARFHPNFEGEYPGGGSGAFHLSSPSTKVTRGLATQRLFRVPPCREATIHLETSMSSPKTWTFRTQALRHSSQHR